MNVKKLTLSAILLAIGYLLHQFVPGIPFLGGMKMDFLLIMMFFSIFMMDNYREVLAVSLACGVISAMTTTFPGGQIANLVDKLITGALVFQGYRLLKPRMARTALTLLVAAAGTILSGSIFLATGLAVSQAPLSFGALFLGVVLPTAILNTFMALLLQRIMDRAGYVKLQGSPTPSNS